jgi:hypothetical protein
MLPVAQQTSTKPHASIRADENPLSSLLRHSVSSRTISSPNTNPSLTSDGMPYSSSPSGPPGHRRELSNSTSRSSIRVSRPSYDDSSATPTSSSSNQIQSQQQDHDPLARTHSIASSVASQRTAQSSQSHSTTTSSRRTHNPLQHASSPYQDRPSSPYNQSFADQQQQQHPSHSASTSSSRRGPVEPSFASGSREASQASVNSRSLGRYPTFEAGGGSSSLYSASDGGQGGGGGGGGGSSNGKERMNLSEEFHFPRPSKDEVDRLFEGLMGELLLPLSCWESDRTVSIVADHANTPFPQQTESLRMELSRHPDLISRHYQTIRSGFSCSTMRRSSGLRRRIG